MPNRAERRRTEREARKGQNGYSFTTESRNQMSMEIRKAINDRLSQDQIREKAALWASGPLVKAIYAGAITILCEDYGFSSEQCYEFLQKLDEKSTLCVESQELVEEAYKKVGIIIRPNEAFERLEKIPT